MHMSSGEVFKGHFKGGLKHGKGIETFTNGDVYEGEYSGGKFHGHGIVVVR